MLVSFVKRELQHLINNSRVHNTFLLFHQLGRVSKIGRQFVLKPGVKTDFWYGDTLHRINLKHAGNKVPC
jgi:hypothetical protein